MDALKRMLVIAFAPAAQRWALVDGNRHGPRFERLITARGRQRAKRRHATAIWRHMHAR